MIEQRIKTFAAAHSQKIAVGALFLANLVFFLPFLFTSDPKTIGAATGDLPVYFHPIREFAAAQLSEGHFPFWNPYSSGGRPFLADPESGLFYPFTYLFSILPSHLAFSWNYFIHYLIGGYGIFFLCRNFKISEAGSLAAAFIFLFSAPHLLHLYAGHFTMINTLAWTPWLFWGLERFLVSLSWRHAAWTGLFLALHLLGGFPFYTYLIGWTLIAYGLYACAAKKLLPKSWKIIAARLGCGLLLGAGVFWVQASLTQELVGQSTRQSNDFSFVSSYSISMENLITLLVPKYYGEQAQAYFGKTLIWENTCYMGILALLFSLVALGEWRNRATRFWCAVFLVSFAIATGPLTPVFKFLYEFWPGFSLFRGYGKTLTVACLALAILAGKGLDVMTAQPGRLWIKTCCLTVLLPLLLLSGISLTAPESLPFWKEQLLRRLSELGEGGGGEAQIKAHFAVLQNNLFGVTLFAAAAAGLYGFRDRMGVFRNYLASLLCLILFVEFSFYAKSYFTPLNLKDYALPSSLTRPVLDEPDRMRVFHDDSLIANLGMATGVSSVGGFENFALREYSKLASFFNRMPLNSKNSYLIISPTPQNMNFYAANYVLSGWIPQPPFAMETVAVDKLAGKTYYLFKKSGIRSRFNIARQLKPFPIGADQDYEQPEVYAKFVQTMLEEYPETIFTSADIYRELFSKNQTNFKKHPEGEERIRVILEEANRTLLEVELASRGALTVSENYYPGWRAKIDGVAADLFPVNLIMKAVEIPSGRHLVELYFIPTRFYGNMTVSLISLLILSGLILFNPGRPFPLKPSPKPAVND